MEVKYWIVLTDQWKLYDVQAGLVVIISLLSFIAVFTSARMFWHASARRISKNADVPISSLLSFTTLGEVMDVAILLKSKLFSSKHFSLAVQCLLVIAFSTCAILAGPISRYATRQGQKDAVRPVPGLLASRSLTCDTSNTINWHNVSLSLDQAGFPYDQLVDFLPDTKLPWSFHSEDWNSTYTAKCSKHTEANLTLEALGVYADNFTYHRNVPGLLDVFSAQFLDSDEANFDFALTGVRQPAKSIWESAVFSSYGHVRTDKKTSYPIDSMAIHLSTVAMLGAPLYIPLNGEYDYSFSKGKFDAAWYTKVECEITRVKNVDSYSYWEAYPYDGANCAIAPSMDAYFAASTSHTHGDNTTTVVLPTSDELFRFYQSYMAAKDTWFPHKITRNINLRVPTVEISTLFIGVMSLLAVCVILGLIHCLICRIVYGHLYSRVPETKVDWLLQSLREAEGTGVGGRAAHSHAPSTSSIDEYPDFRKEKPWEKARYSLANPHYSPVPTTDGYTTPATTTNGLGRISVLRGDRTPSPVPGALPSPGFLAATSNTGYNPLPNPAPYMGASPPPAFSSPPMSPNNNTYNYNNDERVVSYGMTNAKSQPIVSVAPRNEKGEWEVGVIETRH